MPRLEDEVVIIEHGLGMLAPLVIGLDRVGECNHRAARFRHAQNARVLVEPGELCLRRFE